MYEPKLIQLFRWWFTASQGRYHHSTRQTRREVIELYLNLRREDWSLKLWL